MKREPDQQTRKPYSTPKLRVYGDLPRLTMGRAAEGREGGTATRTKAAGKGG